MILVTNWGALALVDLVTGRRPQAETFGVLRLHPLVAPPPIDKTKITVGDYSVVNSETDPVSYFIEPATWTIAVLIGGRAVSQAGPPALEFEVMEDFTCYGFLMSSENEDVPWFELFETPQVMEVGGLLQILPSIAMASECPPLGGCP